MPARSLFPPTSIQEARVLPDTIAQSNAGQPMRRIDIFDVLARSAASGASRNLVTASSGFGLTNGGYQAEQLSLTELGVRLSVDGDETAAIDAVLHVEVFRQFFETYANSQLPSDVSARSFLAANGVPTDRAEACLELIRESGRSAGLIDQRSGVDYVLSREHAMESQGASGRALVPARQSAGSRVQRPALAGPPIPPSFPGLQFNVEIHLPNDQTPEVYDAIFASMRKHLIDGPTQSD